MRSTIFPLAILALAVIACGFSVDLPSAPTPGPDVTDAISVPAPVLEGARLTLKFGAGDLSLSPGAPAGSLVDGTATYNVSDFKPEISTSVETVSIEQGDYKFRSVPDFGDIKNEWDLRLGDTSMDLTVLAGAYDAEYELGGLALTGLTIKDGAADVKLSFDEPNRVEMNVMRYETGASNVEMEGLANANFNTFVLESGAGQYEMDFSGSLQRNAFITIQSGLSNIRLRIPDGIEANITIDGSLKNVSADSGWDKNGNIYTQAGTSPSLTFLIEMSAGNLTITD